MLYEEYGYVIYKIDHKHSVFILGTQKFTPLELTLKNDQKVELFEKVYLGNNKRTKIENISKWISENEFSCASKNIVLEIVEKIILENKDYYLNYINDNIIKEEYKNLLIRALCIGPKTYTKILNARKVKPFDCFTDLEKRASTKVVVKNIAEKIYNEISGKDRFRVFSNKAKHID
jgi:putative nucleotide binding protein